MLASRDSSEGIADSNLPVFHSYFKQPKLMTHIHKKFGPSGLKQIDGIFHDRQMRGIHDQAGCAGLVPEVKSSTKRLRSPTNFEELRKKREKQSPHCKSVVFHEDAPSRSQSPRSTLELDVDRDLEYSTSDLPVQMKQTVKITFKLSKDSADFQIAHEPYKGLWSRAESLLAADDTSLLEKWCLNNLETAASTLRLNNNPPKS